MKLFLRDVLVALVVCTVIGKNCFGFFSSSSDLHINLNFTWQNWSFTVNLPAIALKNKQNDVFTCQR